MKPQHSNHQHKNKKTIAGLCALLLASICVPLKSSAQQQPFSYTQYMTNLTQINPAYALMDKAGQANIVARKQWIGIDGAPSTFMFNGSLPIESINAAAGLMISNDQFAVEHQTEINGFFAKAIQLDQESFLSVGMNFGIRNYVANYSTLDATDPQFRNDVRETKPNIGFGVMYNTAKFYASLSVPELTIRSLGNGSVQDQTNFRNHYYFATAYLANMGSDLKFKPALLMTYARSIPFTTDISGTVYVKDMLGIGLSYNTNNEAAGIFSVNMNTFRLGYSYQFGTASNNIAGFSNATHEITLGFRFGKNLPEHKIL